jgi:hypothetical protein
MRSRRLSSSHVSRLAASAQRVEKAASALIEAHAPALLLSGGERRFNGRQKRL